MKIMLNHHIFFDFDVGTVFSAESQDDPIQISNPAKRLLYLLLTHPGEVVSREILFKKVWDDFGMVSSNNNLNQCISKLRRVLRHFNPDHEIIITVPKVGFMLHREAVIEELAEQHATTLHDNSIAAPQHPAITTTFRAINLPRRRYSRYALFFVTLFLLIMISASSIWLYESYQQKELFIGTADNCAVKVVDNSEHFGSTPDVKKALLHAIQRLNLHCSSEQYILLTRNESLNARGRDVSRYQLLFCEKIAVSKFDVCWAIQSPDIVN